MTFFKTKHNRQQCLATTKSLLKQQLSLKEKSNHSPFSKSAVTFDRSLSDNSSFFRFGYTFRSSLVNDPLSTAYFSCSTPLTPSRSTTFWLYSAPGGAQVVNTKVLATPTSIGESKRKSDHPGEFVQATTRRSCRCTVSSKADMLPVMHWTWYSSGASS